MEKVASLGKSHPLIEAIRDHRASLFLGSGASFSATNVQNPAMSIPSTRELAKALSAQFLNGKFGEEEFRYVYDLACSEAGVRSVQKFVHDLLVDFWPSKIHLLLPKFAWKSIFTTNWDLIVERAYSKQSGRLQNLKTLSWDPEGGSTSPPDDELWYLKLHGSISAYEQVDPPLIASTDQLIRYKSKRRGMFDTFLEHAKLHTVIFSGYSFNDYNLRSILQEIIEDGQNHPPHYTIVPDLDEYEVHYWQERRIRPLKGSFEAFIEHLDKTISTSQRKLGLLAQKITSTTFSRFITKSGSQESAALVRYFSSTCLVVSRQFAPQTVTPKDFYSGRSVGWGFIKDSLDVVRYLTPTILGEQVLAPKVTARPKLVIVKSYAGGGRTVFLKRLAWEIGVTYEKLVCFIESNGRIDTSMFEEIFSLTNLQVCVILDDVSNHLDTLKSLVKIARQRAWPLTVIGSDRFNEWNVNCADELDAYVTSEYDLRKLTDKEAKILLSKLEKAGCLGELATLSNDERFKRFTQVYNNQILVALYESTRGWDFQRIVTDEYDHLVPRRAQLLYLDICSLHRFGVPARAGLISRVHDISFSQFKTEFFLPLEQVVYVDRDGPSGDYIYTSRHRVIAEMVYQSKVISIHEKFDNMSRIISKLNPTYSYDIDVVGHMVRALNLIGLGFDLSTGSSLYDLTLKSFGSLAFVYHQWAVFLQLMAVEEDTLDKAEMQLGLALELEPKNPAFRHSEAEIALKRSRIAVLSEQRLAWRTKAVTLAQALTRNSRTPHPFHTIAKARLDSLQECLRDVESEDVGYEAVLDAEVKDTDKSIRDGLDRFPNDPHLLTSLSEFYSLLANSDKALNALEKAFKAKPQSVLVARRLASAYLARNKLPEAQKVLLTSLEHNPTNADLHYEVARLNLETRDFVDDPGSRALLLHHLIRSVQRGDKRYDRRFWYARELFLNGHGGEAKSAFDDLANSPIPFALKRDVRGEARISEGTIKRYTGVVRKLGDTYCFLRSDELPRDVYASIDDFPGGKVVEGGRVSFSLAFNMFGPVALDLQLIF